MNKFHSNGKLLLTGEYLVLDGAKALALPTKVGQTMQVKSGNNKNIHWVSKDVSNNIWFEDSFEINSIINSKNVRTFNNHISKTLFSIFQCVKELKPSFFENTNGFEVQTVLEFPQNWGLGSSSTLVNNIALWTQTDAYTINKQVFRGSGYDIACANAKSPILFSNKKYTIITNSNFSPKFKNQLFFIYLNKKQNSKEAIANYHSIKLKKNIAQTVLKVEEITNIILKCKSVERFKELIEEHECIISAMVNQRTVKQRYFSDFEGAVKSLGAWGGDFILAVGEEQYIKNYFRNKGFTTIIKYSDMVTDIE